MTLVTVDAKTQKNNKWEKAVQTHAANQNILNEKVQFAMQDLIKISQRLLRITDDETQKLVSGDVLGFALLQDEKEKMTKRYAMASREFRTRLHEFRQVDQATLEQLNKLQVQLSEKTRSNNVIIERMKLKSRENTQKTLITAQELAQQKIIQFKEKINSYGSRETETV